MRHRLLTLVGLDGPVRDGWTDVAICVVLTVVTQVAIWVGNVFPGPSIINCALALVSTGALLWRRRRPMAVLSIVVGVLSFQALAFGSVESAAVVLPLLVAVYSAATYADPAYLVAAISLLGVSVHTVRDSAVATVGDATFSFIVVGIVFVLGRVMHARRSRAERAMAEAEALRHGRQAAIDAAIADERRRMAREIHDVVANGISVMAIQAGAAERLMDEDPGAAKASLQRIRATGHDVVREKGRLVELLRGDDGAEAPTEQSPSLASLDHLVGRMRSAGLDVRVTTAGVPASMGAEVETTAFRLVQEGLTNQLKHSPDAPVTVTVRYSDAAVEVEVVGGFATTSTIRGPGHGIEGLRERTDSLGGDFEAGPYEGGWRMRALLPAT